MICIKTFENILIGYVRTDRQTDRQTDTHFKH
jgi:hypothetical protein